MSRFFTRMTISALTTAVAFGVADLLASISYAQSFRHEHPSHERPRQCKGEPIQVTGPPKWFHNGAMRTAIDAWSQDVVSRFGTQYAEYDLADGKQPRCFHSPLRHGLLLLRHRDWQCTITAVPCQVPPGTM
jgi:hypothetical protein